MGNNVLSTFKSSCCLNFSHSRITSHANLGLDSSKRNISGYAECSVEDLLEYARCPCLECDSILHPPRKLQKPPFPPTVLHPDRASCFQAIHTLQFWLDMQPWCIWCLGKKCQHFIPVAAGLTSVHLREAEISGCLPPGSGRGAEESEAAPRVCSAVNHGRTLRRNYRRRSLLPQSLIHLGWSLTLIVQPILE